MRRAESSAFVAAFAARHRNRQMASEPAYVRAFKDMIRDGLTEAHGPEMLSEFYSENDRSTIILTASIVDQAISASIQTQLLNHGAVRDMFDPDGALGTFSAKISLAFGMRIYGKKTKHDLDLIRLLRNGCAHSEMPIRFSVPQV